MARKKNNNNNIKIEEFLQGKKIPVLTLDNKWHKLFPDEAKPAVIKKAEKELNSLIQRQGQVNNELKEYKHVKANLMKEIVENMEAATSNNNDLVKKQMKNQKYILEINEKLESHSKELDSLPEQIRIANERLMLVCMEYLYTRFKENDETITALTEWIKETRALLTQSMIEREELQEYNAAMYGYMHDLFGAEITSIFDIKYKSFQNEDFEKRGSFENGIPTKKQ